MCTLRQPKEILKEIWGHSEFRGRQAAIIDRILRGRHTLVIMPTGMGKSACFQIPAILFSEAESAGVSLPAACLGTNDGAGSRVADSKSDKRPLTLVMSPLIALMKDQVDALVQRGVDATFVNSSIDRHERVARYKNVQAGMYDLLYVTPERFRKPDFCEVLSHRNIVLLAVDEAHCISEWGHDFRPDYTRVGEIRQSLGSPTTIALTATATSEVQADIVRQLELSPDEVELFHEGIHRPNLSLDVIQVWDDDAKLDLIVETRRSLPGSGIVYFTLIRKLMEFSESMWAKNIPHLIYHGDLPRHRRRELQESFMNEPGHIVLATNAFGMGVDKEDIRYVLHADFPGSIESYYQEIGRAGRDGNPARCVLMYDERDLATQMEFVQWSNPDAEFYSRVYDFLCNEIEPINAFGIDWLRERIHFKQKHDRRLETTLAMLQRWGVVEGSIGTDPGLRVVGELPYRLRDAEALATKLQRDHAKLYAMLQYVKHEGDRKEFIHDYFGVASP